VTHNTTEAMPDLTRHAQFLLATAGRAPSVHNTQPWRFRVSALTVELECDPQRKLRTDPAGREMLISCGAALFGLRLAVRSLGYQPVVELLPDPRRLRLLARLRVGEPRPMSGWERGLLDAIPHRHTHRGPFAAGPLPAGLLAGLQHDARSEGATLAFVESGLPYQRLARIVAAAARSGDLDPRARADVRDWTRKMDDPARDGVPARAFTGGEWGEASSAGGSLAQRDFELGRGLGRLGEGGQAPSETAVLTTAGDQRADWLRAGQALQRLLLHATTGWVFARLHTQPLESASARALIGDELARDHLAAYGNPQLLLQFGSAATAPATARRPPVELAADPTSGTFCRLPLE
jgi:hypothetical protein